MLLIKNRISFLLSKTNKNLKQHIKKQLNKEQQIKQQQLKNKPFLSKSIDQWRKQNSFLFYQIGFMSPFAIGSLYYGFMQPFNSSFLMALDLLQLQASLYILINYRYKINKKLKYAGMAMILGINGLPDTYGLLAPSLITLTSLILDTIKTKEQTKKQTQQDFKYAKLEGKVKMIIFMVLFMIQLGKIHYWIQQRKIKKLIEKYQIKNKS